MKILVLASALFGLHLSISVAQQSTGVSKPAIGFSQFDKFDKNSPIVIPSPDGKYLVSCQPDISQPGFITLSSIEVRTKKRIEIGISRADVNPEFAGDDMLLFKKGNDSLLLYNVKSQTHECIPNVNEFKINHEHSSGFLAYTSMESPNEVRLMNLQTKKSQKIAGVKSFEFKSNKYASWLIFTNSPGALHALNLVTRNDISFSGQLSYSFSPNNRIMLVTSQKGELEWFNLETGLKQFIGKKEKMSNLTFNLQETMLAFINTSESKKEICFFKEGNGPATTLVPDSLLKKENIASIQNLWFSPNNQRVLFAPSRTSADAKKDPIVKADVRLWSYNDLKSPIEGISPPDHLFAVDIDRPILVRLTGKNESVISGQRGNDYVLVSNEYRLPYDSYYNQTHAKEVYLVKTATGQRNLLFKGNQIQSVAISPNEKYVVWFDTDSLNWFSYELSTGGKKNISKDIPYPLYNKEYKHSGYKKNLEFGLAAWKDGDKAIYLYDQFDLWEVDPGGLNLPVNITKGAGRAAKIVLGLVALNEDRKQIIHTGEALLISAYDQQTKDCGFWKTTLGSSREPVKGSMQHFGMYITRTGYTEGYAKGAGGLIWKTGDGSRYIVTMQSAEKSPNWYLTSDFIHYDQLTDYQPEKKYNWLTAELINWQMADGRWSQGILYMPENFDPSKKYPLIFNYYERRSGEFHDFRMPNYTHDQINIAYFVSNGYMIFVPDIYYRSGHNGQGTVNAVVSAAKYLSKLPYVDSTKLGLQGHSFAGWQTNFLVTHTQNLFAAACEASGVSDQISAYNQFGYSGGARQEFYELGSQGSPYGLGITPSSNSDLYLENSPALFVNKVTTPLLMMHGDKDSYVPYLQALEMYMAMKRAGKKVWMLEYPNEGHALNGEDAKDYTIRMKQFFDHYLMGAPAPKWMTMGIGVNGNKPNVGYELDAANK